MHNWRGLRLISVGLTYTWCWFLLISVDSGWLRFSGTWFRRFSVWFRYTWFWFRLIPVDCGWFRWIPVFRRTLLQRRLLRQLSAAPRTFQPRRLPSASHWYLAPVRWYLAFYHLAPRTLPLPTNWPSTKTKSDLSDTVLNMHLIKWSGLCWQVSPIWTDLVIRVTRYRPVAVDSSRFEVNVIDRSPF